LNVDGDLVFSANGIDIPDPLDIAEIDVTAAIASAVTAAWPHWSRVHRAPWTR